MFADAEARAKRKECIAKNERQHVQNLAKIPGADARTGARKRGVDRRLVMSTASLYKYDRVLDGDKKLRGLKRKVT